MPLLEPNFNETQWLSTDRLRVISPLCFRLANLPAFCGKFPQSRYWSLDSPAKRFFPKRMTSSICEFFFCDKKREAQKDRSLHFVFLRKKRIFVVISSKYFRFLPYHVCLLIHCAGLSSCFFFFISRILIHHVSFLRD